jgi:phosphoglycerol transferase
MSVIVGFLSIFAVVLVIEHLVGARKRLGWVVAVIVTGVGLFDQVTPAAVRPYARVKAAYDRDQAFVNRVEASVPRGAMIFQLPYQRFPENDVGPGSRMADYDQLRLYLHSGSLRWSYPAICNRSADAWIGSVSQRGPAELVDALSATGFAGIVIDRNGYPDKGAAIESALGGRLGLSPAVSADGRATFFSLVGQNEALTATLPAALRDRRGRSALQTVSLRWMDGFFAPERGPNGTFRWCSGTCEVQIENPADVTLTATIKMTLFAAKPPASLGIEGDLLSERVNLPRAGTEFLRTVTVSPGRHVLRFHSDGAPADAPLDPRRLVWLSQNAEVETQANR